jgi:hypothetical protein
MELTDGFLAIKQNAGIAALVRVAEYQTRIFGA